jgi:hypothetical protein
MPVIEIINRTDQPVSTTIGTVRAGRGRRIVVPVDLVPKSLIEELEDHRDRRHIEYNVLHDPDIRDEVELRSIGKPAAVESLNFFVDAVQGNNQSSGEDGLHAIKDLQVALDKIPNNIANFVVNVYLGAGDYTGTLKSKFSANEGLKSDLDEFDDPYSFLFGPTDSGAIRLIGTTESVYDSTIASSAFNSLQIGALDWVVDEHVGRLVRIFDGPVTKQFGLIKGNTEDTLEVDFFFEVPEVGEYFEILDRTTNLTLSVTDCGGLTLVERCNVELSAESSVTVGTQYCAGSLIADESRINSVSHFMNSLSQLKLHKSKCEIGFGSYLVGVPLQIAEYFSILSLAETKVRQGGVPGTHIGTQDYEEGVNIFGRHNSQVMLYDVDVDDCVGSFVVLVGSQAWIGFSLIGQTVALPNHILEGWLNSTYADGGGNVFLSTLDNILLETGSVSVDSTGGSEGGAGVKIFPDEATLLAAVEDDGTIAFAELEGSYWLRTFNTWIEHYSPPAPPGSLTGQDLVRAGTTLYSAKIPSGLSAAWSALTPGSTISNYVVDPTYTLDSPDSADRFLAGTVTDGQPSAGSLDLVENGSVAETYDIATNGVGTIGRISITALVAHNEVFQRANARLNLTLIAEGRNRYAMQHSQSGLSNEDELYYDDVNPAPSFAAAPTAVLNTKVSKWLSGIEAWGIGTTVDIGYTAAAGIFTKAYHPTQVGNITFPGHSGSIDNPGSVPAVSDQFVVSRTITLDVANQSSMSPSLGVTIRKPDTGSTATAAGVSALINTYGTVSTGKDDQFFDEARRIVLNSGTTSGTATPFTSSNPLVNGNAQQRHNGTLQYPDSGDYPGFTADQEYQRFIDKSGTSVGAITFAGINYTDVDPYGTGDLNVLIELAVEGKFFDLGRPIGSNNGTGAGDSRANSKGARNDSLSSGSTLHWSLGTDSTAFNNNEYRLIIIFRNSNHSITRITEA